MHQAPQPGRELERLDLTREFEATGGEDPSFEHRAVEEVASHRTANEDGRTAVEPGRRPEVDADVAQGQATTHPLGINEECRILDGHRNREVATAAFPDERSEAPATVGAATGMHDGPHDPQGCDLRIARQQILDPGATRDPRLLDREQRIPAGWLGGINNRDAPHDDPLALDETRTPDMDGEIREHRLQSRLHATADLLADAVGAQHDRHHDRRD